MITRQVTEAIDLLRRVGAGNPRLEAELLLAEALQRPRTFLFTDPDYQMTAAERARFDELVGRRLAGEPLQYVLGTAAFRELELRVGPGVLIPRSETEVLVEVAWEALQRWHRRQASRTATAGRPWVIDVGVGSGAILLALLHEARRVAPQQRPWFRTLGIDIARRALQTTVANLGSAAGYAPHLVQGDLLSAVRSSAAVAAIVSNPPYVTTAELRGLPAEIREHEPPLALHGGRDGLDVIRALLDQTRPFLARGTLLCFEIGGTQHEAVTRELARRDWARIASVHPDLAGRPRVVLIEPVAAPQSLPPG